MTSNLTMSIFYATLLLEFMPLKQRKDRKIWKNRLEGLFAKEIECSCGRTHFCDIEEILIEENAICRLPGILSRHSYKKLCVVCDEHTEKAAGFRVYEELTKAGYNFSKVLYHEPELVPDEQALIYLLHRYLRTVI